MAETKMNEDWRERWRNAGMVSHDIPGVNTDAAEEYTSSKKNKLNSAGEASIKFDVYGDTAKKFGFNPKKRV